MNGYQLSRKWWDFTFENPELIKPNHSALYFFCIEHCNRLGWKSKFGLPTEMAKEAIGIRSYNTYIKTLNDLVDFQFIKIVERSKNQFSSNIIALSNFDKALNKALDKASIKHTTKHILKQGESTLQSTIQSICSINKPLTIKHLTENIEQIVDNLPEVINFLNTQNLPKKSLDVFPDKAEELAPPLVPDPNSVPPPDFGNGLDAFRADLKIYLATDRDYQWSPGDSQMAKEIFLKLKESYPGDKVLDAFKKVYSSQDSFHSKNFDLTYFNKFYNRINGSYKKPNQSGTRTGLTQNEKWAQGSRS